MHKKIKQDLKKLACPKKAETKQRFFKTGKGEYAEGDVFIGVTVPETRKVAKQYKDAPFEDLERLIASEIHEERLCALLILVLNFPRASESVQKQIYQFYLKHTRSINHWDLIDLSAPFIVGPYLVHRSHNVLFKLAKSKSLWERRIAMLASFHFIKNHQFDTSLQISEMLLHDEHDLIHKAVGWMLREIGKRDQQAEETFLKKHYKTMPRTMLRYAIEKFPETLRQSYLKK